MTDDDGQILRALLLDRLGDEPPPPPLSRVLARCDASLRAHRRRRMVTGAVAAVALAGLAPQVVDGLFDSDTRATATADLRTPALTDAQAVARCRSGNQGPELTDLFYASGTPTVREKQFNNDTWSVVLLSADGRYWADCFINTGPNPEFPSGMTINRTTDRHAGTSYSEGGTCGDGSLLRPRACPQFAVDYVDRLPSQIAAVEFLTVDGVSTKIDTDDGFVVFMYSGDVPDDYSWSTRRHLPFLQRVTYLDTGGDPIASENMGTADPDERRVDDLDLLSKYRSLRTGGVGVQIPVSRLAPDLSESSEQH